MMKDYLITEQPRERFVKYGSKSLSDEELLAILFRTGVKDKNVKEVARDMLNSIKGIKNLNNSSYQEIAKLKGIGEVKAITLFAALELGKRVLEEENQIIKINTGKDIFNLFKYDLAMEKQEKLIGVFLDNKNQIIAKEIIFIGTVNSSVVHAREVFKLAVKYSAVKIIIVHNHPSGNPLPSKADDIYTNSLIKSGDMIGIPVIDHIIIGKNSYYSYLERTQVENV